MDSRRGHSPLETVGASGFPISLAPGAASTLLINIKAPAEPGDYELVFELVQERVAWFDAKGAEKLIVPFT